MDEARIRFADLDVITYNDFVGRFHEESDRAAAVLGGCFLESFLEEALRCVFAESARTDRLLGGRGALGTLAAKIDVAVAMRLIDDETARNFDLVRKTRNHFAHHLAEAAFALNPVRQWSESLTVPRLPSGEDSTIAQNPRTRYLFAIAIGINETLRSEMLPHGLYERYFHLPQRREN